MSALQMTNDESIKDYDEEIKKIPEAISKMVSSGNGSTPESIAETLYTAASDGTDKIRYVSGKDGEQMLAMKKELGDEGYFKTMCEQFLG